ncbi:hypothetical protein [Lacinutrix chionoecetis]
MKRLYFILTISLLLISSCKKQVSNKSKKETKKQMVFTKDVDNFWKAHDKIKATKDSTKHLQILTELFLDKGTPGLPAIMEARRYKPQEYVDMINNYPLLWESIREKTFLSKGLSGEIENGIQRLKNIYPDAKPAQVYFTVGVFRTGGTTIDDKVLIGVETGFGDKHVNVSELPDSLGYIKRYWATKDKPTKNFALTNVHEYIHTQQNQNVDSNLLGIVLLEGIAEFVSTLAMGIEVSNQPAIIYGKQNSEKVRAAFEKQMFSKDYSYWVWSDKENEFGTRDLGYYVGFAMAKKYYEKSKDKDAAIKEMIELDLYNESENEAFAEKTGYLSKPIAELKEDFELQKP